MSVFCVHNIEILPWRRAVVEAVVGPLAVITLEGGTPWMANGGPI